MIVCENGRKKYKEKCETRYKQTNNIVYKDMCLYAK